MSNRPLVELLTRRECELCDAAKEVVAEAAASGLCELRIVDVDRDKGLLVRYGLDVPVIMINGREAFRHRLTPEAFRSAVLAC